ncbi:MAG TPA: fatty acid cis/trans isomerase [Pseudomonadales bacterium]|nr:fatty acid cis/trans isomerase [Pseudomonadales bacterium]
MNHTLKQLYSRHRNRKAATLLLLLAVLIGCTPLLVHQLDERFGVSDVARYNNPPPLQKGTPEYWHDVRPLLEQRCTVCHGCYDAPCQQNLTSWDGIARGSNAEQVYTNRLAPAEPSRLFVDAQTPEEWRERGFHPVLNEREDSREANLQGSVMYRILDLKRKNPLPEKNVLNPDIFTFSLSREQTCPTIEKMDAFEKEHAEWGMPYGLPALSDKEFSTMEEWLAAGSPVGKTPALPANIQQQITVWEDFFNGTSLKQKLVSRYIYEHLYLSHIYFDEVLPASNRYFFHLVRSSTPPGEPVDEIATRRPYDDPGSEPFWYRIRFDSGSVVEKTHMPYALNSARMAKWQKWFVDANYTVDSLPSYAPAVAGNPFLAFYALPIDSRYRFLLDDAQFIIDTFIKGPVCRGQVALSVIQDNFWVFFVDPDKMPAKLTNNFLMRESKNLRLPSEDESDAGVLDWLKYSRLQKDYLKAKSTQLGKTFDASNRLTLDLVWNGSGNNDNAALTIFRHSDSASVVKGLVGPPPKTAWLISYALLERIYYLLVAGFDVYGSVGHQLNTRLYMDFLRMEGEANFIALLPLKSRKPTVDSWYRGASNNVKDYIFGDHFDYSAESGVVYHTNQPQQELYKLLAAHIGNNVSQRFSLQKIKDKKIQQQIMRLQKVHGIGIGIFPENSVLRVDDDAGKSHYFTLIHNDSYSNISQLLDNAERRRPAEDTLTVVPGIVGAYPNAFFRVPAGSLAGFVDQLANMQTETDYTVLLDRFGVRRTSPDFWAFSDALQRDYIRNEPVEGGVLDYNRFENR